jgi:hypothetical protein
MSSLKRLLKSHNHSGGLLVTPRYEQYLATHPNILVDDTIAQFVVDELTTPQRNRRMTFSASSRGACPREQVFQFTSVKPVAKTNSDLYAIFHQGTFMHLKWQALLLDAGILSEPEVKCTWEEYNLTGTIDGKGVVPSDHPLRADHDVFGWELKSINSRGYQWILDRGPNHHHLLQIHAYMLATGWRIWSLCYENKDTQQWKEFLVTFDPEIAEEVEAELDYLNRCVNEKKLPPVLEECQQRTGAYRKCAFAHVCLDVDEWPEDKPVEPRRIKLR